MPDKWELQSMQAAPLSTKVSLTKSRIRDWVEHFGEDKVYISFSGGKDSTVLLHIVREEYPDIPAVFIDVPTQYPELKEFATSFDNVIVLKPKITFAQVCEQYGFPLISKEVSECVWGARRYLASIADEINIDRPYRYFYEKVVGEGNYKKMDTNDEELVNLALRDVGKTAKGSPFRLARMLGALTKDNQIKGNTPDRSKYSQTKWKFLLDAPFDVSHKCCNVMKKDPVHRYQRETGRHGMTATMASESRLRTQQWLLHGCNGFDMKEPISNPMAFWTEQDVLLYIYQNHIQICSVYGDVVKENDVEGQLDFSDLGLFDLGLPTLTTTGCSRTGCMLCGFGCHLEKEGEGRFELLKKTHPKMYALMDVFKNNGVTFREAIDWINEHGNLDIKY